MIWSQSVVSDTLCAQDERIGGNMGNGLAGTEIDGLDARILRLFRSRPRISVLEASRTLGTTRRTVQARLDRLRAAGIVTGFGPQLDLAALGFGVLAFVTAEIRQGSGPAVLQALAAIPEVLEVFGITGAGDLLCRVVARDHRELKSVIDRLVATPGIERTASVIALSTEISYRDSQLLALLAGGG